MPATNIQHQHHRERERAREINKSVNLIKQPKM